MVKAETGPIPRRRRAVFSVRNIDCATCALAIEKSVGKLDGVEKVGAAVMLNKVFVDYDESKTDIAKITKRIRAAGYSNQATLEHTS